MKILQIYKDYYPPVKGGIEGHINLLSNGLKACGIDVEVLVSNTKSNLEIEKNNGIKITKVPQIGRISSAPLNFTLANWIGKLGNDADILHFHLPNPTATIAYQLSGLKKKVIVTYHSDVVRQKNLNRLYSPFLHFFLDNVDIIIATSPNYICSSEILCKYKSKCKAIPLGINPKRFIFRDSYKDKIELIKSKYGRDLILFIGRLRYYKGLDVLIDAMRQINGILLIIGSGPCETEVRGQIAKNHLEDKIVLLGDLADEDVNIYLHACDLLVLPSTKRSEAFGIVQLEAMACGKPVVSTELNTGTSYVNQNNKTGFVVNPFNIVELKDAINTLIENPEIRNRFGCTGKGCVENYFTIDRMVENYLKEYTILYNQLPIKKQHKKKIESDISDQYYRNKRKVKILRVISRLNIGGPAIHVKNLSEYINQKKYKTILISGSLAQYEGDMSYVISNQSTSKINIPELQRDISPFNDLIALISIIKVINRFKPDVVHTHLSKAGTVTRIAVMISKLYKRKSIKTVHTFHGHVFEGYFSKFKSLIFILVEMLLAKNTDVIIALSATQKWELTEKYHIANLSKIKQINLGFDLLPFLQAKKFKGQLRQKYGLSDHTILIGIVGRLTPIKNQKLFLDAANIFLNQLKEIRAKFILIGDGEEREFLEKYAKEIGIQQHVEFYGWEKNIPMIYADLDILALTSLNEGTPVSIIEAMASSVPVITTGVGGVKDLLGGFLPGNDEKKGYNICERGILCVDHDPNNFANGLLYMVKNGYLKNAELTKNARSYVFENYSRERLIKEMEELYADLVEDSTMSGSYDS